jgi:hypothetical protein
MKKNSLKLIPVSLNFERILEPAGKHHAVSAVLKDHHLLGRRDEFESDDGADQQREEHDS